MFRIELERECKNKKDMDLLMYQMCVELYNIVCNFKDYCVSDIVFETTRDIETTRDMIYLTATMQCIGD